MSEHAPDHWATADAAQGAALGLPERPEGWGLLMFETPERRWTWAGDPKVVEALSIAAHDVPDWDEGFTLDADGWPGDGVLTWRERD